MNRSVSSLYSGFLLVGLLLAGTRCTLEHPLPAPPPPVIGIGGTPPADIPDDSPGTGAFGSDAFGVGSGGVGAGSGGGPASAGHGGAMP